MSKMFADVQPAVRKETKKVAIGTFVCVVLMWAVFGIGHLAVPEQIPFDYTVLLAGFIGGMVAVLNFFLMGLTVQKIVSMEDDKQAAAPDYLDPYGADHYDRWLLCLCDPQLFPSYWSGSWLSDRRRGRIEASERGRDEGASGELLHKR